MSDKQGKTQIHIRADAETERKLRELATAYGTLTTVIAVAVDRLYQDTSNTSTYPENVSTHRHCHRHILRT